MGRQEGSMGRQEGSMGSPQQQLENLRHFAVALSQQCWQNIINFSSSIIFGPRSRSSTSVYAALGNQKGQYFLRICRVLGCDCQPGNAWGLESGCSTSQRYVKKTGRLIGQPTAIADDTVPAMQARLECCLSRSQRQPMAVHAGEGRKARWAAHSKS